MTEIYFTYAFRLVHGSWPAAPQSLGISPGVREHGNSFCYNSGLLSSVSEMISEP